MSHNTAHERIEAFNSSLITEGAFRQPLTQFAIGWKEKALEEELEFWAPEALVNRRFEFAAFDNAEEFLGNEDDTRPPRADFKEVEYSSSKIDASTANHGLQVTLDLDQITRIDNWEEYYVEKLLRRIRRNSIIRAIELLKAAATNTNKTWDGTAGKDPDSDVLGDLVTATAACGVTPNRVGYGPTAWQKRVLSLRAQAHAGGFAGAALSAGELADYLNVDQVFRSRTHYASGSVRTSAASNQVIMFQAATGTDTEDPSNIKRFVSMGNPEEGGGRYQVYSQRLSAKRHVIAVGYYELIKITSTLGIRKFTIS